MKGDELLAWIFLVSGLLTLVFHRPLANIASVFTENWVSLQRRARVFSDDYYDQVKKMGTNKRSMRIWMLLMGAIATAIGGTMLFNRYR